MQDGKSLPGQPTEGVEIHPPGAEYDFMTWPPLDLPETGHPEEIIGPSYADLTRRQKLWARMGYLFVHRTDLVSNLEDERGDFCMETFLLRREENKEHRRHMREMSKAQYGSNYPLRVALMLRKHAKRYRDEIITQAGSVDDAGYWISYERHEGESFLSWWHNASYDGGGVSIKHYPKKTIK